MISCSEPNIIPADLRLDAPTVYVGIFKTIFLSVSSSQLPGPGMLPRIEFHQFVIYLLSCAEIVKWQVEAANDV